MSIKEMVYAMETAHRASLKLMLIAIANHANDDGDDAYPGMKRLARACSVSERQATRLIRELEEIGEIAVSENDGARTKAGQRTNRYSMIGYKARVLGEDISDYQPRGDTHVTSRDDTHVTPTEDEGMTPTSPLGMTPTSPLEARGVTPMSPQGVTPMSPNPSVINHQLSINRQDQSSVRDDDDDDKGFSVESEILEVMGKKQAERLIKKWGKERVLHGCQFVLASPGIRKKSGYAIRMIESGDEMAPVPVEDTAGKRSSEYLQFFENYDPSWEGKGKS